MPSNEADQLRSRADAADKIIADLRAKICDIKDEYVKNTKQDLEEKLIRENSQLKAEVIRLKQALNFVEVRNGIRQIPLPVADATSQSEPVTAVVCDNSGANDALESTCIKKEKKDTKKDAASDNKKAGDATERPVDVSRLDLRVGLIEHVEPHPDADSLYVEKVNIGTGVQRTVISGLVKHVPLEQMQNKKAIFLCNLKAAKMRGIMSEGMIMCASSPDKVEILEIPQDAVPGTRITFDEYAGVPDELLVPKKKIWEQVAPDLKVDASGVATYKGAPFRLNGQVVCKAPTLTNVQIK